MRQPVPDRHATVISEERGGTYSPLLPQKRTKQMKMILKNYSQGRKRQISSEGEDRLTLWLYLFHSKCSMHPEKKLSDGTLIFSIKNNTHYQNF